MECIRLQYYKRGTVVTGCRRRPADNPFRRTAKLVRSAVVDRQTQDAGLRRGRLIDRATEGAERGPRKF